jgi:pyrimidine operon attenuation protein/uracil phosphoribosyltransferase
LKTILTGDQLALTIKRLSHQILENNSDLSEVCIIGIQPRGVWLSERIAQEIRSLRPETALQYGILDITFYRDDVRNSLPVANQTDIPFSVENKKVIIIDDVLYTGRTIRAALDALIDFGRPRKVELCVLIDRRFSRELPIQPDYSGKAIDSIVSQRVKVYWKENHGKDEVVLL